MINGMTEGEFLRYSARVRHKKAAKLLRAFYDRGDERLLVLYRRVEAWMELPRMDKGYFQQLSDRYHYHLSQSEFSWKEHNLLSPLRKIDQASSVSYLPVAIYLDNLRSAFNVGSILRTVEAFRLGTVHFSKNTPFIDNPKVQKTSMQTFDKVPCDREKMLSELPHPLIALETDDNAPSVFDFAFPVNFTLMLGNEEYGLSEESLSRRSHTVKIPLYGFKNSLNVASAFAIAAGVISHQLRSSS